jgi:hypothetical protein
MSLSPKEVRRGRPGGNRFTAEEDHEIIQGYHLKGPKWAEIKLQPHLKQSKRNAKSVHGRFKTLM